LIYIILSFSKLRFPTAGTETHTKRLCLCCQHFSSLANGKYVFGHIEIYIDGSWMSFVLATVCIHFNVFYAIVLSTICHICVCICTYICTYVWQLICGPVALLLHINNDFFAIWASASVHLSVLSRCTCGSSHKCICNCIWS